LVGNIETYLHINVNSAILLSNVEKISIFSADFHGSPRRKISRKMKSALIRADTDGHDVDFRDYANVPNKGRK